jgi:glycosyltransferase involved in cell wall biosynthesis
MIRKDLLPLVTTVIPTYRRPALLKRAIESVLGQEGVSLRVCVFDNASGDQTREIVHEIASRDDRVTYYCHERNLGGAANFEFGLRSVETPYFSLLSDDDYLLPGFYARALSDLAECPDAIFWAGMTLLVDDAGAIWKTRVQKWPREGLFGPQEGLMLMMHGQEPTWTGILFRRDVLDRIGLPDRETLGPSDLDYTLRIAARHAFIMRKYPAAVFSLNPGSYSATQPLSSFWPGWKKMFKNIEAISELDPTTKAEVLAALHRSARRMLLRRGAAALADGRYEFARAAAGALKQQYGSFLYPQLLRSIAAACELLPLLQRGYSAAYRTTEQFIVRSHADLQLQYGHLLSRPD